MASEGRILIIDDDSSLCEILRISLKREGYDVTAITDPRKALEEFRSRAFDLVIQDIKMPGIDGLALLRRIKEEKPDVPVVIITAFSTWDRAVEAMRLGAFDYIRKPFHMETDIRATVRRALDGKDRTGIVLPSAEEILEKLGFVVGYSRQMKVVWEFVRKAAQTDSTCLIQGESGTGKELVARALHFLSPRGAKPFNAINCGAIPETLLESELFGHVLGAFTDAVADKPGLIELARGGTVFLDEISEMSPGLQVKILRVLEEKEFRPVGATQNRKADVRFVAATNRDLSKSVKSGTFRQDLYYRLNVIPIFVPPLRERPEDIPILADYFLRRYCRQMGRPPKALSEDSKQALMSYGWPGNIRELENLIQRAVTLSENETLTREDFFGLLPAAPERRPESAPAELPEGFSLSEHVQSLEANYLRKALERSGGNHTRAAQLLGMSLSSFRYKLQKYGLL